MNDRLSPELADSSLLWFDTDDEGSLASDFIKEDKLHSRFKRELPCTGEIDGTTQI